MKAWLSRILQSHHRGLVIQPLDLNRDYPEIDRSFVQEEWPFLRSDLELSHRQPSATSFVARKDGRFAGFFMTHAFGHIGYLDMLIIAPEFRKRGVARPLYFSAIHGLGAKGIRAFVVHTTNESAPMIKFLGFSAGSTFSLLRREPIQNPEKSPMRRVPGGLIPLGPESRDELVSLDAHVFGMKREPWIDGLLDQADNRLLGWRRDDKLVASACLRPRRNSARCLDSANAYQTDDLEALVREVVELHPDIRLECFARTNSPMHRLLEQRGFIVPDFFKAIGPLIEWRQGDTGSVGLSERVQTLNWF